MTTDDQETREWARALFADPDAPETAVPKELPVDPSQGNVVPREGEVPATHHNPFGDFVAELFARADR